MTAKPTAVVVRLPLSEEQKACFYSRHYTGDPTPGLLAIGTPVAGGELEVIGYVSENSICLMTEQAACSIHLLCEHESSFDTALVRQSDAQAALAAAQAENVRLREVLRLLLADWEDCMGDRPSIGSNAARTALKGPAA